jgi:hypothetical protein
VIRVELAPEPPDFFEKVQKPGEAFLATIAHPKAEDLDNHPFWREILPDLYDAYSGICAYSCLWISTGDETLDHFQPKHKYPEKAYRWDNFRLASRLMNTRKSTSEQVLDPFTLPDGWFILDFPALIVKASAHLSPTEAALVNKTIAQLRLNDEVCKRKRHEWLEPYVAGDASFRLLKKRAPFLASELERQKLKLKIRRMMRGRDQ